MSYEIAQKIAYAKGEGEGGGGVPVSTAFVVIWLDICCSGSKEMQIIQCGMKTHGFILWVQVLFQFMLFVGFLCSMLWICKSSQAVLLARMDVQTNLHAPPHHRIIYTVV